MDPIQPGDVIRVTGWPGCRGIRLLVQEVHGGVIHALEIERGGATVRHRWIPLRHVKVDRRATRERRQFEQDVARRFE